MNAMNLSGDAGGRARRLTKAFPLYVLLGGMAVLCSLASAQVTQTTTWQGTAGAYWNVASNWSGGIPSASHEAIIPMNTSVDVQASVTAARITVMGSVRFVAGDINVTTERIDVMNGGQVLAGTATAQYSGTLRFRLYEDLVAPATAKRIMVHPGAMFALFGEVKSPWLRLADLPQAFQEPGAWTLAVEQAVTWNSGDRIVVSSTDYDMLQAEELTLAANAQSSNLSLASPLAFRHFTRREPSATQVNLDVDMRASVGRLTRNIVIEGFEMGENEVEETRWGGDIIVMQNPGTTTNFTLSHVELTRMGKYGALGRYPIHFHDCGDMYGQALIEGCSIHHCFHRAVVVHDTNGVQIRDNVAYDIFGHAYMLEDGSEVGNRFEHNLGLVVRTPEVEDIPANYDKQLGQTITWSHATFESFGGQFFRLHDRAPAVFWISNYANEYVDNVAAGSDAYGFAFDMRILDFTDPANPSQVRVAPAASTESGPFEQFLQANGTGPSIRRFAFSGNTAHSNGRTGFFSDSDPHTDAIGRARPTEVMLDSTGNMTSLVGHYTLVFDGITAFKCRNAGIWYRQYGENIWRDVRLSDNHIGVYFGSEAFTEDVQQWSVRLPGGAWNAWTTNFVGGLVGPGIPSLSHVALEDSFVLGDSANVGDSQSPDWHSGPARTLPYTRWLQVQNGTRIFRSYVRRVNADAYHWVKGLDVYDGLNGVVNTHFENFRDQSFGGETRRAAAMSIKNMGVRGRWANVPNNVGDFGFASNWHIDPRNYSQGVSFTNSIRVAWPAPIPPRSRLSPSERETIPVPDHMRQHVAYQAEQGLIDTVIYDLDGSLTGFVGGFATNLNTTLMPTGTAYNEYSYNQYGMVPATTKLGQVVVEYPWDYDISSMDSIAVTTGFRHLTVRGSGSSSSTSIFDMLGLGRIRVSNAATAYRDRKDDSDVQGMTNKRIFGFNVPLGLSGASPEYEIDFGGIGNVIKPNLDSATDYAVHLRFGEAGQAATLRFPCNNTPVRVSVANYPLVGGQRVGMLGTTHRPAPIGNTQYWDARQYVLQPAIPQSSSRVQLDNSTGSAWWHDAANDQLYLKLVLPSRNITGVPAAFTGQEVILLVQSAGL